MGHNVTKLVKVGRSASGPLTFRCRDCGSRASQADGEVWADLMGPPFAAYLCDDCAQHNMPLPGGLAPLGGVCED